MEAEDFDDFNPYVIEVKQEPDPGDNGAVNFEWVPIKQEIEEKPTVWVPIKQDDIKAEPSEPLVQIKHEALDLEDVVPNYTPELAPFAISQEEIKVEPPEPPVQIKQEELDLADVEYQNMDMDSYPSSVIEDNPIETIVVDGDDDESEEDYAEPALTSDVGPGDAIEQVQEDLDQQEIATICVDDSDDEPAGIDESTVCPSEIEPEPLKIVQYKNLLAAPSVVYNSEHECVPRRIYHNSFLKRFVKNTTYRGYSVRAARLLNGARNQFTHIYACDHCDRLCANHELIKQHVDTHKQKRSIKHPLLFVTAECQICFQRNLDDLGRLREHLNQEHSDEIYKAAKGQKFAVRIECRICRRWFPMIECLECGEEFDRCFGITWHNRIHRRAERQKKAKLNVSSDNGR